MKSKIGVPLVLLIVAGLYSAVEYPEETSNAIETIKELLPDDAPVGMEVPPPYNDRYKTCTAAQVVNDKRCGDDKVLPIDAKKMPHIARNISLHWKQHPQTAALTKASYKQAQNYKDSGCATFVRTVDPPERGKKGSCDEFPFKSTEEGGAGSRIEEVPRREQDIQGGVIGGFYSTHKMVDGDKYVVVLVNTASIAPGPYKG
ncbi:NucA/NucB deoxyribonuclease domain-containing protein [Lentzea flava]|uniref:NucA/NucB deoxyribonuclease domain-containing protein n=1 Tax=Lentzea flava TaxID=103732 RepID=UPI00166FFD8C|nr:NucA/NucB deoxyribonuclease domain-containing protein [Lentzea flava]